MSLDGLEFLVMIASDLRYEEIVRQLAGAMPGVVVRNGSGVAFSVAGNIGEVRRNPTADPVAATDPVDGFLSYPLMIEVTPVSEGLGVVDQVRLAMDMRRALKSMGVGAVVCAGFEDLLEER